MNRAIRKVKVLGYPFAGGQPRGGVELTPSYLAQQDWFKQLCNNHPVEYEQIRVSDQRPNAVHE